MKNIGVYVSNEWNTSAQEILDFVKECGFDNVMLSFKDNDCEISIQKAKSLGIDIPFIHLDTQRADDLWVYGETNESYVSSVISQIKICGKYKIPIAVIHANEGRPTSVILGEKEQGKNSMLRILEEAKKNNVKIALENVDGLNYDLFAYLLDNISSEWLGFCYDVGHHHLYNLEKDLLKKYGGRLIAVHMHDNLMDWYNGYDYTRDLHMLPFDGKIDFNKVCNELAQLKYSNTIMLEIRKIAFGEPMLYKKISNKTFLKKAKTSAERLFDLINEKVQKV